VWPFGRKPKPKTEADWKALWQARQTALESVLGPADDGVFHSPIPFELGGNADVLVFRHHVDGVVYCTADLIGDNSSRPNKNGQYELVIATDDDSDWAPGLISSLARYTTNAVLNPWDTMDIGPALPQPTRVTAFLYVPYANLTVLEKRANLLLCLGITAAELKVRQKQGGPAVIEARKAAGTYPLTVL